MIANDAIGNFVVVTPLLQMLREALQPAALDYFGGKRTWELQTATRLADWTYPLLGTPTWEAAAELILHRSRKRYDLVVNVEASASAKFYASLAAGHDGLVCGPCLNEDGRRDLPAQDDARGALWDDPDWTAEDLPKRFPFLSSGFIGEILCRLCYLDGPIPMYQVPTKEPPLKVPDVLLATAASLPQKLWPTQSWAEAVNLIGQRGLTVGLLGAKPAEQKEHWQGASAEDELLAGGKVIDLRGRLTLPEVAGALAKARIVLTIDNGIMHMAVAAGVRTVALFRHGYHRLWAPPVPNLHAVTSGHAGPVSEIPTSAVLEALKSAL